MALYHFEAAGRDGTPLISSIELKSIVDARAMALQTAGSIIRDFEPSFWRDVDWTMTVSDARRLTLFSLTFLAHDAAAMA